MTIALAIPPLIMKNRGGGGLLIRDRALNQANTVYHLYPAGEWQYINTVFISSNFLKTIDPLIH